MKPEKHLAKIVQQGNIKVEQELQVALLVQVPENTLMLAQSHVHLVQLEQTLIPIILVVTQ